MQAHRQNKGRHEHAHLYGIYNKNIDVLVRVEHPAMVHK